MKYFNQFDGLLNDLLGTFLYELRVKCLRYLKERFSNYT